MKIIKGSELKGAKFFMFLTESEMHKCTSTNSETLNVTFTDLDIVLMKYSDAKFVREVGVFPNDIVSYNEYTGEYRSKSVLMGETMSLEEISTWVYFINCGVDVRKFFKPSYIKPHDWYSIIEYATSVKHIDDIKKG